MKSPREVSVDLIECNAIDLSGFKLFCSGAVTASREGKELSVLLSRVSKVHAIAARSGFLRDDGRNLVAILLNPPRFSIQDNYNTSPLLVRLVIC